MQILQPCFHIKAQRRSPRGHRSRLALAALVLHHPVHLLHMQRQSHQPRPTRQTPVARSQMHAYYHQHLPTTHQRTATYHRLPRCQHAPTARTRPIHTTLGATTRPTTTQRPCQTHPSHCPHVLQSRPRRLRPQRHDPRRHRHRGMGQNRRHRRQWMLATPTFSPLTPNHTPLADPDIVVHCRTRLPSRPTTHARPRTT